ncbi:hypothetical protein K458DRAFT_409595 [Lentithecium fluviatile CBS 122367]|uniref:Uncharacterized protein n=1 Tax=Lentithecium fluviatile CBS 122367 TaxID=1168545 RepID=A0A6G1IH80_9PLEO|nr:hypothetical protein K458DRAFT_409595 [Lentithecium fluviatile CBS 122367]
MSSSHKKSTYTEQFWFGNAFQLNYSSLEIETSFSEFRGLGRWLGMDAPMTLSYRGARIVKLGHSRGLCITLQFNLEEYIPLEDLRVSIMDFITATAHLKGFFPHGLHQLRSNVFVALRRIVQEVPEKENTVLRAPCPQIWINSRGEVVAFSPHGSTRKRDIPNLETDPDMDYTLRRGKKPAPSFLYTNDGKTCSNVIMTGQFTSSTANFVRYLHEVAEGGNIDQVAGDYFRAE